METPSILYKIQFYVIMSSLISPFVELTTVEEYKSVLNTLTEHPELAKHVEALHIGVRPEEIDSPTKSFFENQTLLNASLQNVLPNLINLVEFKYVPSSNRPI